MTGDVHPVGGDGRSFYLGETYYMGY